MRLYSRPRMYRWSRKICTLRSNGITTAHLKLKNLTYETSLKFDYFKKLEKSQNKFAVVEEIDCIKKKLQTRSIAFKLN